MIDLCIARLVPRFGEVKAIFHDGTWMRLRRSRTGPKYGVTGYVIATNHAPVAARLANIIFPGRFA